jgi:hypothetical protein
VAHPSGGDGDQHELELGDRAEAPPEVATERRTLIVGRTTRRTHELELIEPKGDAEFPGPWQVRAVVDEREVPTDVGAGSESGADADAGADDDAHAANADADADELARRGSWLRVVDPER